MILVGCGSAGKETLAMLLEQGKTDNIFFYDENKNAENLIFEKFKVIKKTSKLLDNLKIDNKFCVCIGNPRRRKKMYNKLIELGGSPNNVIWDKNLSISELSQNATIIQPGVHISYEVIIGKSCLIHNNTSIGHKTIIGDFVNIGPLCSLIGPCTIGNETYISAGSIILPNVTIGNNVYVKAGSIVNRDLKDFETF
jgi:sugar O-acyltransferase (sialic acid O-acetyltransferase NeuD family)